MLVIVKREAKPNLVFPLVSPGINKAGRAAVGGGRGDSDSDQLILLNTFHPFRKLSIATVVSLF